MTSVAPAEAVLIRRAREACGYSPETAAALCAKPMSGRRWRQIEAGEESRGGRPAHAEDGRLAHMAHTVAATPEELRSVDRPEAAEILTMIRARERTTVDELLDRLTGPADTPADDLGAELAALRARLEARSSTLGGRQLLALMSVVDRLAGQRVE